MTTPDILYIHGFEGSLDGTKGTWLQKNYHTVGPHMSEAAFSKLGLDPNINHDVTDLFVHIQKQIDPSYAQAVAQIDLDNLPNLVVASSFGAGSQLEEQRTQPSIEPSHKQRSQSPSKTVGKACQ